VPKRFSVVCPKGGRRGSGSVLTTPAVTPLALAISQARRKAATNRENKFPPLKFDGAEPLRQKSLPSLRQRERDAPNRANRPHPRPSLPGRAERPPPRRRHLWSRLLAVARPSPRKRNCRTPPRFSAAALRCLENRRCHAMAPSSPSERRLVFFGPTFEGVRRWLRGGNRKFGSRDLCATEPFLRTWKSDQWNELIITGKGPIQPRIRSPFALSGLLAFQQAERWRLCEFQLAGYTADDLFFAGAWLRF